VTFLNTTINQESTKQGANLCWCWTFNCFLSQHTSLYNSCIKFTKYCNIWHSLQRSRRVSSV